MSTIAAIATGPAAGGIGIIRLSGPAALTAARRVAQALPAAPTPRHAYFTRFTDAAGAVLDEGLALYFRAPHSFTGEDVVELHAHGAPRLLSLLLAEVLREEGVRLATAGEFTRRAFLSGRIDLARAEAVADLVAAESEAQVRSAAAQLAGELTARLEAVHAPLLALHADLEGALDFPEEAEGADADAASRLDESLTAVRALLADAQRGALVRRGARVVLFGPVNAGKSTLFNALAGANRALVDAEPGTTRDTLEVRLELSGLAVTLVDTAGLRETTGRIEALGIGKTREALASADVAVLVLPPDATDAQRTAWRTEADPARLLELRGKADLAEAAPVHPERSRGTSLGGSIDTNNPDPFTPRAVEGPSHVQPVGGKSPSTPLGMSGLAAPLGMNGLAATSGTAPGVNGLAAISGAPLGARPDPLLAVSGQTGQGLEALRSVLARRLGAGEASAVLASSERHLAALTQVEEALTRARSALDVATTEVVAGEVGLALEALSLVTGADASAALLDSIFARFCIGK